VSGDAIGLFGNRRPVWDAIEALQRLDAGNDVIAHEDIGHRMVPEDVEQF
jgi:hypothetical protein